MTEFELKLEIPPDRLQAVTAAVRKGRVRQVRMRATYFDTDDSALARAGIAVRLRREGRAWVQTAKAAGESALHRAEHNVQLPTARGAKAPAVSLALHEECEVGKALRHALGVTSLAQAPPLQQRYTTDVTRLTRRVRFEGATVEIALDRGQILAGQKHLPLHEIEFEHVSGDTAAVIRLARRWRAGHGLWLNTVSKAERGQCLAAGLAHAVPTAAGALPGRGGADAPLWLAAVRECTRHVTANASAVAAGSTDAEHVHQLRVGLRRARTALRDLKDEPDAHAMALERALARTFRELGVGRDRFYLEHSLQPRLLAEGGPRVDFGALGAAVDPAAVVAASDFQNALFDLLAIAHGDEAKERDAKRERRIAARRLARLHRRICKDAARFERLDAESRHRVRKRLKRLRYLAEFCAGLFPARKVDAFVKRLKPVQDALGTYNDEVIALEACSDLARSQPEAWFGAGWLAARIAPHARDCRRELERLSKAKVFWD